MMTRGLGDPVASAYCHLYMAHCAEKLPGYDAEDSTLPVYSAAGLDSDGLKAELIGEEDGVGGFGGSVLPLQKEIHSEKWDALREWRRLNASRLAKKDQLEKEMRNETLLEADEFKADFYKRRQVTVEKKKVVNRERQKIILENHEKSHKEAATNDWKTIAEPVPKEVPTLEKRGKNDKHTKKPSITIIQGPKPGKPTDLSRMRQIISKLKHHTLPHLTPPPFFPYPGCQTCLFYCPCSTVTSYGCCLRRQP